MQPPLLTPVNYLVRKVSGFTSLIRPFLPTLHSSWTNPTSPTSQRSTMTLPMSLANARPTPWLLTAPMISRLTLKKVPLHPLVPCTLCPSRNLERFGNSLTSIFGLGSSGLPNPLIEPLSSLFGRRMAPFDFASTSAVLTKSPRKIVIPFPSFPTSYPLRVKPASYHHRSP